MVFAGPIADNIKNRRKPEEPRGIAIFVGSKKGKKKMGECRVREGEFSEEWGGNVPPGVEGPVNHILWFMAHYE